MLLLDWYLTYLYFGQEPELVAGLQVVGLLVLVPLVAGLLLPDHW